MNQLPAHLANRQRRDLVGATLGGLNTGSPPHISIEGNRFTLVDDAGNKRPVQTLYLDVCVIDANPAVSKIYFDPAVPFVPGGDNANPPICWSDNGVGASTQASRPQHTSCQICPHNAWGSSQSKATGKATKACNDQKKLAVLLPGMDMVFVLRVPPASLKNLAKYTQTISGHGVDLPDAITRVEFESQGVLKFSPVGYVDEATAALSEKVWAANATDQMLGKNDRPWQSQLAAPAEGKEAYAQRAQQLPPPPAQRAPAPIQEMAQAHEAQPFGAPPPGFAGAMGAAVNPFGQGGTSSPMAATQQPPPPKPRQRKAAAAPAAQAPAPSLDTGIPPFLQRNQAPTQPAPAAPGPAFGMYPTPPAPDAGVQAALDAAFNLPTS